MRAPTSPAPAADGASFPFPQHRFGATCSYPASCNDGDVTLAWANWKKTFVTAAGSALRVKRPTNANDTVSEGIGYGMMAAAYMADRATFDGLWAYASARLDENGVMNWHYDANGGVLDGGGGATDADEDMAFALVMADAQWPGGAYAGAAKTLIGHLLDREVEDGTNVLKPGDRWGGSDQTNPSYLAPAYYRVFASYTGESRWMDVVDASYTLLDKCANAKTGLVPDWCNAAGAPQRSSHYSYDACRTPWRIAVDACWNGEVRATAYLARACPPSSARSAPRTSRTATGWTARRSGRRTPSPSSGRQARARWRARRRRSRATRTRERQQQRSRASLPAAATTTTTLRGGCCRSCS